MSVSPVATREVVWRWNGVPVVLGVDEAGRGKSVLLLPALSSISTKGEMRPLLEALADSFRVCAVDWPGFGERPRPKVDWNPESLSRFLDFVLSDVTPHPFAIVAAGHGAAYALHWLAAHPQGTRRLALIAPTWRGPFPTMMGGRRPWFAALRAAFDAPIIGAGLYALNLSGPVARKMAAGHVYESMSWFTRETEAAKRAVTAARGARYASVRFVTGALDRVDDRVAFLRLANAAKVPILLVYGAGAPPKSRAEMEALAELAQVRAVKLPQGKLAVHEEFAPLVAAHVHAFLSEPD